jgi:hypothetical protein
VLIAHVVVLGAKASAPACLHVQMARDHVHALESRVEVVFDDLAEAGGEQVRV